MVCGFAVRKSPETGFLASRPIFTVNEWKDTFYFCGGRTFTFLKWIMSPFLSFAVVGKTNFAATGINWASSRQNLSSGFPK